MQDVTGDTWVIRDEDAAGRRPVHSMLLAVRDTEASRSPWLFWGAAPGVEGLAPGHDPLTSGLASIDPEALIAVVREQSLEFDWLLLRDFTQRIEFGVFDSSFMFVRADRRLAAPVTARFGHVTKLDDAPGPIMSIWSRAQARRG